MSNIISASRRTDIPAHYVDIFLTAINQGAVRVKNKVVSLKPEDVTCIVFWTKNPRPLVSHLDRLSQYSYYFQFTITGYGTDIEPNLPPKFGPGGIIETFRELSKTIGKDRIIWRYDPIFIGYNYTVEWHIRKFEEIANLLHSYTNKCVISIYDPYWKTLSAMASAGYREMSIDEQDKLFTSLRCTAAKLGFTIAACAERGLCDRFGFEVNKCIDPGLISKITGKDIVLPKDPSQRPECQCVTSIDIGNYNTCKHNCIYCYANSDLPIRNSHSG